MSTKKIPMDVSTSTAKILRYKIYFYKNNSKSLFYIEIILSSEIIFLLISPEKGHYIYLQIYSLEGLIGFRVLIFYL